MTVRLSPRSVAVLLFLLAAVTPEPARAGLVGHWNGDSDSGGTVVDSSGNGHDGFWGPGSAYASGPFGNAFNLAGNYISIPDSFQFPGGGDFSLAFWFDPNGTEIAGRAFVGQDEGGGYIPKWFLGYAFGAGAANVFSVHLNSPSGAGNSYSSDLGSEPAGWHHFALVYSSNTFSFYFDGVAQGTQGATAAFVNPNAPLTFGFAEPGVSRYSGLMDEVRLYDSALSAADVQGLAAGGAVPEPATMLLVGCALGAAAFLRRRTV